MSLYIFTVSLSGLLMSNATVQTTVIVCAGGCFWMKPVGCVAMVFFMYHTCCVKLSGSLLLLIIVLCSYV